MIILLQGGDYSGHHLKVNCEETPDRIEIQSEGWMDSGMYGRKKSKVSRYQNTGEEESGAKVYQFTMKEPGRIPELVDVGDFSTYNGEQKPLPVSFSF